ncbi:DUF4245 domain-containing protein [Streptomyces sp. NPDC001922]|uniref:DUF4245 domain-containing protein n=1 Tax=Streptomyces sp. NPDC001922 TaxID=3364624 RepID=UPI0036774000
MRGTQTVRDMVLSMAVIGVVVASIYIFVPHDESQDPVKPIGYRVELDTARRAAPYPVAAPQGLPKTWRATSVTYNGAGDDGAVWHLGFMDPTNQYVAVEQSNGRAAKFIDSVSRRATKTDRTQKVGDTTWERYEGPKYDALVRKGHGVTTVVTGTASFERLGEMAAALETASAKPSAATPSATKSSTAKPAEAKPSS